MDAEELDDAVENVDCDENTLAVPTIDAEYETIEEGLCAAESEAAAVELEVGHADEDNDGNGVPEVSAEKLTAIAVDVASTVRVGLTDGDGVSIEDELWRALSDNAARLPVAYAEDEASTVADAALLALQRDDKLPHVADTDALPDAVDVAAKDGEIPAVPLKTPETDTL